MFTSHFVPYNEFAWTNCTASPGSFVSWDSKIFLEDLAETAHNDRAVWTRTYHSANTLIIISAPKHYFFDLFFLFSIKKWLNAFDGTGWRNCPRSPLPVSLIRRNNKIWHFQSILFSLKQELQWLMPFSLSHSYAFRVSCCKSGPGCSKGG